MLTTIRVACGYMLFIDISSLFNLWVWLCAPVTTPISDVTQSLGTPAHQCSKVKPQRQHFVRLFFEQACISSSLHITIIHFLQQTDVSCPFQMTYLNINKTHLTH